MAGAAIPNTAGVDPRAHDPQDAKGERASWNPAVSGASRGVDQRSPAGPGRAAARGRSRPFPATGAGPSGRPGPGAATDEAGEFRSVQAAGRRAAADCAPAAGGTNGPPDASRPLRWAGRRVAQTRRPRPDPDRLPIVDPGPAPLGLRGQPGRADPVVAARRDLKTRWPGAAGRCRRESGGADLAPARLRRPVRDFPRGRGSLAGLICRDIASTTS